jgi:SAM-dependent methyltransferase
MSESSDYWVNRAKRVSRFSQLKTSPIVQWLLSVRAGDEAFLRQQLALVPRPRVLDVACGGGKVQISKSAARTYGVDIVGFPREVAESRGYVAIEYASPDYEMSLPESVNVVTCIDLNAHVAFVTFRDILASALAHLEPGGRLLCVCEFDNDGIGYSLLKRFPARFKRYVLGMKHWYFTTESEFVSRLEAGFPELKRLQRVEVACIPPLSHFYACYFDKDVTGRVANIVFRFGDILISLLNNLLMQFPRVDSAFRVGFVYEFRPRA